MPVSNEQSSLFQFCKFCKFFTHIGPEAVPFLTRQLYYDRSGIRLKLVKAWRWLPLAGKTSLLFWSPERRAYAAVALRRMGPRAKAAIPALMERWNNDDVELKPSMVAAMGAILGVGDVEDPRVVVDANFSAKVLSEAAHQHPDLAAQLGLAEVLKQNLRN